MPKLHRVVTIIAAASLLAALAPTTGFAASEAGRLPTSPPGRPSAPPRYGAKSYPHALTIRRDNSKFGARTLRAQTPPSPATAVVGGAWSAMGPTPVVDERCCGNAPASNFGNVSGRVTSLVADPTNASTVFAGSAGGGVWKSTTGGTSWSPLTDSAASLAIGSLAIDPTGQIIFAGTGENNLSDSQAGQGILKSTNGGTSWTVVGQAMFAGHFIGSIAIDRTNAMHVLAATDLGLAITTNGGTTWAINTSYIGLLYGVTGHPAPNGALFQIIQDPTTATKYWLSAGDFCNTEASDILTGDGLNTWTRVTPRATLTFAASRIGLGVGASGVAYFAAADCNGNLLDVEKTTNGGTSWTQFSSSTPGLSNYFNLGAGGQGYYDNVVAVDPTNGNHAVFGGVTVLATSNGGSSFTDVGKVYSGGFIHPDFHDVAFTAANSFYIGNDGGVWKTTDLGGTGAATDWTDLNAGLSTIQFYHGSALDATRFLGGAQDNGSPGNLPGAAALPSWQEYHGGDGAFTAIDPTPGSTTIYAEYPFLTIEKGSSTLTGAASSPYNSFVSAGPCGVSTDPACSQLADFVAPFVMDPANPLRLLGGGTHVYQTTNGGTPAGSASWTAISGDLTSGTTISSFGDTIASMSMGTTGHTGTVITGSRFGKVFLSTDATGVAATWTDITGNLPVVSAANYDGVDPWISSVAVNSANPTEAWATIGGLNVGHFWHTTNAGSTPTTWTDISGIIPNEVADAVVQDPTNSSTIYGATDFGVWVCTTCGGASAVANWAIFGSGLPNAKVNGLSLTHDNSKLVAWTHGRGAFTISLATPTLFSVVSTLQYHLSNSDGSTWMDMDTTSPTPLTLTITPTSTTQAILSGNSDLWTANAGFNQDFAIDVNGTIVAWKESGGFAGTFSPNAAYVQAIVTLTAGTTYTIKLRWKTNKAAAGATIYAGAGNSPTFSPTRLTAQLVTTTVASAVSTHQYTLTNSDGATWMDMDSTSLSVTVTPSANSTAVIGGNSDLFTANAGFNQDIAITVNGTVVAWKESGGFAGTFSPNAAFVQAVQALSSGTTYTIKLQWKTNKAAAGSTIYAGAGPIGGQFSPTSLIVQLFPAATSLPNKVSTLQYQLMNSDGATWTDIDGSGNLTLVVTPSVSTQAIIGGNADLWTSSAGFNQDIGIDINGTIVAWKESGGFAGTFSPNAAFVQTVIPMNGGTTYTIKLRWKTNKNAPGATIWAGAGPIAGHYSPTSLTVQFAS